MTLHPVPLHEAHPVLSRLVYWGLAGAVSVLVMAVADLISLL